MSDFDEGKRSCRRKLERHNNRRRRKPSDSKESMGKDSQLVILADDVSGDDDIGKGRKTYINCPILRFLLFTSTLIFFTETSQQSDPA